MCKKKQKKPESIRLHAGRKRSILLHPVSKNIAGWVFPETTGVFVKHVPGVYPVSKLLKSRINCKQNKKKRHGTETKIKPILVKRVLSRLQQVTLPESERQSVSQSVSQSVGQSVIKGNKPSSVDQNRKAIQHHTLSLVLPRYSVWGRQSQTQLLAVRRWWWQRWPRGLWSLITEQWFPLCCVFNQRCYKRSHKAALFGTQK